jgi:hypothetical protein
MLKNENLETMVQEGANIFKQKLILKLNEVVYRGGNATDNIFFIMKGSVTAYLLSSKDSDFTEK